MGAWNRIPGRVLKAGLIAVSLAILFLLYLGVALTIPYDSEHAAMMLMGRDMLQGNLLLRGWTLGTQPYLTTELPFYALGIWILGFTWKVIYLVTGLHWAVVAFLIIVLASTSAGERLEPGKVFVALSLTLLLPPLAVHQRWLSYAHLVGFSYCLLALLSIRRIEKTGRRRYYAAFFIFLTLAATGDFFAIYLLAVPVVAVCSLRLLAYGGGHTDFMLVGSTVSAVAVARLLQYVMALSGGAHIPGVGASFVSLPELPHNAYVLVGALLDLFGADFLGKPVVSWDSALGLIHASALILLFLALYVILRTTRTRSVSTQITAAIVIVNLVETLLSTVGPQGNSRYLAPTLLFGIILVCQVVFESALYRERSWLVLAYFAVLAATLLPQLSYTKPISAADALGRMLVRLHLPNGYGPYWRSHNVTVATAGQAAVSPVYLGEDGGLRACIAPRACFTDEDWYRKSVNFMVIDMQDPTGELPTRDDAIRLLGVPAAEYELYKYGYLLVWDYDISTKITRP